MTTIKEEIEEIEAMMQVNKDFAIRMSLRALQRIKRCDDNAIRPKQREYTTKVVEKPTAAPIQVKKRKTKYAKNVSGRIIATTMMFDNLSTNEIVGETKASYDSVVSNLRKLRIAKKLVRIKEGYVSRWHNPSYRKPRRIVTGTGPIRAEN